MKYLLITLIAITLLSCKKEHTEVEVPYEKETIYKESFANDQTWISLPENSVYTPGSECVRIEDHILKLTFDQPLPNCGCAWVGARKSVTNISNIPKDKLGMRIKLNKGFFQYMSRNHYIDQFGNSSGIVTSESSFRFDSPGIQMQIANVFRGSYNEDSTVNENLNKIEGVEFVMIYNEGERLFFIDGVKADNNLINISNATITNQIGFDFQFILGHQPEFSPRLDELFIEELEVFTWQGKYPK